MSTTTPRIVESAAALVIGGEILSGKIRDDNSRALALTLRAIGIELRRILVVPDHRATIAEAVRELSRSHDVVITSGGVGPTHDDVTMSGIADAFGVPLEKSLRLAEVLRGFYGEDLSSAHLAMANLPITTELIDSLDVRWPLFRTENVWSFPGVPELFRAKLAVLREHIRGPGPFYARELLLSAEEVAVKETLDLVVARHPNVEIGSYPKLFDPAYKTKITFDARDEEAVELAKTDLEARLGDIVVKR